MGHEAMRSARFERTDAPTVTLHLNPIVAASQSSAPFGARSLISGLGLFGKTAIVTGGSSGLGLETARALAAAGAHVIVPTRAPKLVDTLLAEVGENIETAPLDLMTPSSIDAFAARFLASGRDLSILINAASIEAMPLTRDGRGNESHFAVNHLGHFHLAVRLWPALRRAAGARVVSVSSSPYRLSPFDFDDANFERRNYDKWVAYAQSKTANALFAVALDARGKQYGIRAFSLHTGTVLRAFARVLSTDVTTSGVFDDEGRTIVVEKRDLRTAEQGAATAVWCATSPHLEGVGGVCCENCDIANIAADGSRDRDGVRPWAVDPELAERLWRLSEMLSGVTLQ